MRNSECPSSAVALLRRVDGVRNALIRRRFNFYPARAALATIARNGLNFRSSFFLKASVSAGVISSKCFGLVARARCHTRANRKMAARNERSPAQTVNWPAPGEFSPRKAKTARASRNWLTQNRTALAQRKFLSRAPAFTASPRLNFSALYSLPCYTPGSSPLAKIFPERGQLCPPVPKSTPGTRGQGCPRSFGCGSAALCLCV